MKIMTALNSGNLELSHRMVATCRSVPSQTVQATTAPVLNRYALAVDAAGGMVISAGMDVREASAELPGDRLASARDVRARGDHFFLQLTARCNREAAAPLDASMLVSAFGTAAAHASRCRNIAGIEIDASRGSLLHDHIHDKADADAAGERSDERLTLLREVVYAGARSWEHEQIIVRLSVDLPDSGKEQAIAALLTLSDMEIGFVRLDFGDEQVLADLWDWLKRLRGHFPYHLILSGNFDLSDAVSAVDRRLADAVAGDRSAGLKPPDR